MMGFNLTPMVRNLLLLNVLVFVAQNLIFNPEVFKNITALHSLFGNTFMPYQLLTHLFVHGGIGHLISNMFPLLMLAPILEQVWGPKRFLVFYLICGFGASIIYLAWNSIEFYQFKMAVHNYLMNPTPGEFEIFARQYLPDLYYNHYKFIIAFQENPSSQAYIAQTKEYATTTFQYAVDGSRMVGASGAVFGILVAFGMLFPNLELFLLFIPFPIKAKYFVTFYTLYEVYAIIRADPSDNVAHFAHLGGALFGFLFVKYWQKHNGNVF